MSNYTKTTNFAAKDSLPSGNANKIVKGTEIDTEFDNIATASATKADIAGPTFTGTVTIPTVDLNGGAIDGTTVGASTAAAITGTTIVANTSINIAGDGATVTGIKDEDDMSSNSATKLATQQSIKAYVDSQVTAQDLDFQADSGGALSIDLDSETLTFTGGTGVDTSGSGNAVTFAIDSTVATLTGTQTLTNKTLTSPTLNTPTIGTSFTIGSATITEAELEILDGATVTTAELNVLDGITSTTAELNILDGVTSTAAELNILDGVTATTAEINYVDGVTSNVQTQLDAKAPIASPTFTGTVTVPGLTTSADILFGDNDKAIFGAGSDLQIYHDGSASYIDDAGTGNLRIRANSSLSIQKYTGETMGVFTADGSVLLAHDNATKFETTSTGIDVTGTATMDGLTVSGAQNSKVAYFDDSSEAGHRQLQFTSSNNGQYWDINSQGTSGGLGGVLTLSTRGSERLTIDTSGNVGIGTSSPAEKLQINDGRLRFLESGQRQYNIGVASGTPNFQIYDATFSYAPFTLDGSGNVGIGTSSPSSYQANADNLVVATSGHTGITIASGASHLGNIHFADGTSGDDAYRGFIQYEHTSNYMRFATNATERMRIDSSGNLLVGKTAVDTFNEGFVAKAAGGANITSAGGNALELNRRTSDGTILNFRKDNTAVGSIGTVDSDLIIHSSASGHKGLRLGNGYVAPTNNAGATEDNTTDLGLSSQRFKDLYLSGGVVASASSGNSAHTFTATANNTRATLTTSAKTSGGVAVQGQLGSFGDASKVDVGTLSNHATAFITNNTERARIDSSGNLLVGTTSTVSGGPYRITADGGNSYRPLACKYDSTGGATQIAFINPNGQVGGITTSGSATAYNTSSDQRLKDSIVDAPSASDDIDAIQVRSFDWKADGSHQKYGMVAQELQSVAPEAVTGDADSDEMMGVDYSKLVPMLVKEIQSLRARVQQLENN